MHPGLSLITDVTTEPIKRDMVTRHVRIDDDYQDLDVKRWITSARRRAERYTERALAPQTWDMTLDRFPLGRDPIYIPMPPLTSVTHIKYLDTDGVEQTWGSSNYAVDTAKEPGRVTLAHEVNYPSTRTIQNAVTVRFVAGYTSCPEEIQSAMLLMIGNLYENRGESDSEMPDTVKWLLDPYKVGDEFRCYSP